MHKFIKVKKLNDKLIIKLDNPPVNAESTSMLKEILEVVNGVDNEIIVIWGSCVTSKGRRIFSAGGDIDEIKQGKTYQIAKLINNISKSLLRSHNYIVTILGGDAVGGGWGMPFDISDEIFYLKGSSIIAGFTRNHITPGCGISLLLKTLGSKKSYNFLKSEKPLSLEKLEKKDSNIFHSFENIKSIPQVVKNLQRSKKVTPHETSGIKLKNRDRLSRFINEVIVNPKDAREIQLKYIKMSLEEND